MLAHIFAQATDLLSNPIAGNGIQGVGAAILYWVFRKVSAMDARLIRIETKLGVTPEQIKTDEV